MGQQVKQAKRAISKIRRYQELFESPEGRWVLNDMMEAHGMLSPHPVEPQKMALKEGERLVILRILTFLKQNPEQLRERMEEYERTLQKGV